MISWMLRNSLYSHVISEATSELERRGNDPFLIFFKAFALVMVEKEMEAVREVSIIQRRRDMEYPGTCLMLFINKRSKSPDHRELDALEQSLYQSEGNCGEQGFLLASAFHLYSGNYQEARRLVSKVVSPSGKAMNQTQVQAHTLNAWIELKASPPVSSSDSSLDFVDMLEDPSMSRDIDCLLAKATFYSARGRYTSALDQLNEAIALESWFTPALIEKSKIFMSTGEWDQADEVRVQQQ